MQISIKTFSELNVDELYQVLKLRTDVFVVEQDCAYNELDDYDQESYHLIGLIEGKIAAYARVVPPGGVYDECSIGRIVVHPDFRGKQYGRIIFKEAVEKALAAYPNEPKIKIQAQVYLESFYKEFEFKTVSEPYPDFGIYHVDMIRNR